MKGQLQRLILRHLRRPAPTAGLSLRSQRGQAVTEYILVLVVVVGIALGVLYQLNTAFKKYVQSYFGDYVACLLETGELPSLGGSDGADQDTCNANFEPFSLKNGRPLTASSGEKGGSSGSRRFARANGADQRSSHVHRNGAALNGDRGSGSAGISVSSGETKSGKKSIKGGGGSILSGNFGRRTVRMGGDEQMRLDSRFHMGGEKEKQDDTSVVKQIDAKAPNARASARKLAFNPDAFKTKDQTSEVSIPVSAGDYLRYILIFAILIGIIVFFGGQLNQLRKSWNSGD